VAALALGGCGGHAHRAAGGGPARGPAGADTARLTITLYRSGLRHPPARVYRVSCNPPRGNVPRPGAACALLARPGDPFAPVPRRAICGDIVLGGREATVTGMLRGRRVAALLTLRGTCEIDRWSRVRSVVPGF
jgi:hypothetical protein